MQLLNAEMETRKTKLTRVRPREASTKERTYSSLRRVHHLSLTSFRITLPLLYPFKKWVRGVR